MPRNRTPLDEAQIRSHIACSKVSRDMLQLAAYVGCAAAADALVDTAPDPISPPVSITRLQDWNKLGRTYGDEADVRATLSLLRHFQPTRALLLARTGKKEKWPAEQSLAAVGQWCVTRSKGPIKHVSRVLEETKIPIKAPDDVFERGILVMHSHILLRLLLGRRSLGSTAYDAVVAIGQAATLLDSMSIDRYVLDADIADELRRLYSIDTRPRELAEVDQTFRHTCRVLLTVVRSAIIPWALGMFDPCRGMSRIVLDANLGPDEAMIDPLVDFHTGPKHDTKE